MQSVSQEWIDNQSAIIRKPGFIVVNIPDVKISCGAVSHQTLYTNNSVLHISDPVGCDYLDKCGIEIKCNKTLLGSSTVVLRTFNNKSEVINVGEFTSSDLDTNGVLYWEMAGFSKMELEVLSTTDVIEDIQLYAYGIPRSDIQSYTHSRSYDPMGFELPTNDIAIDIYNYADKYTDFYKSYGNEGYSIVVYYGYSLDSGDEIILGGTFHLTDVQLADDILTLTGECLLAFVDEKASINIFDIKANESGYIHIWVSDSTGTRTVDLTSREEFNITAEDLIQYLSDNSTLTISRNATYSDVFVQGLGYDGNYIETVQYLINKLLNRCFVDRNDTLHYDVCQTTTPADGNHITLMNSLDRPTYSSTKKIKKFEMSTSVNGTVSELFDSGDDVSSGTHTGSWSLDCVNSRILSISMSSRGIYYIDIYPTSIKVNYRCYEGYVDISIKHCSMTDGIVETTTIDTSGVICDISSPLGVPSDTDKIVNYFSNRDLYTFNVRGNPARDVGDYVNVSLTNDDDPSTYKKGLVLSSILSYDGSFKEECTVRIIENDFE